MDAFGGYKKPFRLGERPPWTFSASSKYRKKRVPPLPPYMPDPENLPLESGYYTFVIDPFRRWYCFRGNTSSHASMVDSVDIVAAGRFYMTRAGKVGEVVCKSYDYHISVPGPTSALVTWVLRAFNEVQWLDVSEFAHFTFPLSGPIGGSFTVDSTGKEVSDTSELERLLSEEGQGKDGGSPLPPDKVADFQTYVPPLPPRLYPMDSNQLIDESDPDDECDPFALEGFKPCYCPSDGRLASGKKAFVVDQEGGLVIGNGHHLLAGGQSVGAAGQIVVGDDGTIIEINLNFSGHYVPPISSEYARYTYLVLINHPLITISPDCQITARKRSGISNLTQRIALSHDIILADDGRLEALTGERQDMWQEIEVDQYENQLADESS